MLESGDKTFVTCPSCGVPLEWSRENKYRPFCSERCKMIDLGQWAAERYCVSGEKIQTEAASLEAGRGD